MELTSGGLVGLESVLVLVTMGMVIVVVGAIFYPKASRGLVELSVSDEGVTLVRMDGRLFSVKWAEYRNRVLIVDARSMPPDQKVPALRSVEFVFNAVGLPVQGPIPQAAVRAIIESARSCGHSVNGWSESPTGLGREVDIQIL